MKLKPLFSRNISEDIRQINQSSNRINYAKINKEKHQFYLNSYINQKRKLPRNSSDIGNTCDKSNQTLIESNSFLGYELRKRLHKSMPKIASLSTIGMNKLEFDKLSLPKDNQGVMKESEFQSYRNMFLMKNAQCDDGLVKLKEKFERLFSLDKNDHLTNIIDKIKIIRQSESVMYFSKFTSASSQLDCHSWKNILSLNYDMMIIILKLINTLLHEYKKKEQEISKLKDHSPRIINEYSQLKNNQTNQQLLVTNDKLKEEQISNKGKYLLDVYRLEEEIKDLTHLLDKNKHYSEKYVDIKEEMKKKSIEMDELKTDCYTQVQDLMLKIGMGHERLKISNNALEECIKEKETLNDIIFELKQENKDNITQYKSLVLDMRRYKELYNMLYEEKETWYREYMKEQIDHNQSKQSLEALSIRIKREYQDNIFINK